jgi:hypothetical protein
MSPGRDETSLCGRVLDRLVEGDDLSGDRPLAEHLGSCVTCFRALGELRDMPRLAEALRAEGPVAPPPNDPFWDDLAARTTAAAQSELQRTLQRAPGHGKAPEVSAPTSVDSLALARARRSAGARVRIISVAATLAAAAAGFMLVARGPLRSRSGIPAAPATLASASRSRTVAPAVRTATDEATTDEEADVAELDVGALHRLLDRLRPHAPAALTAPLGGGANDAADVLGDDEGRVNEELADLDGDELRRVASSLEVGRL